MFVFFFIYLNIFVCVWQSVHDIKFNILTISSLPLNAVFTLKFLVQVRKRPYLNDKHNLDSNPVKSQGSARVKTNFPCLVL